MNVIQDSESVRIVPGNINKSINKYVHMQVCKYIYIDNHSNNNGNDNDNNTNSSIRHTHTHIYIYTYVLT